MIERLLAADAALERGELDTAEKLFGSVAEADPRNAIAAVGMGRVAAGRDDADGARTWFQRALAIDPDEAAARRLLTALERVVATDTVASVSAPTPPAPDAVAERAAAPPELPAPVAEPAAAPRALATVGRRSWLDRIRGWLGLSGGR